MLVQEKQLLAAKMTNLELMIAEEEAKKNSNEEEIVKYREEMDAEAERLQEWFDGKYGWADSLMKDYQDLQNQKKEASSKGYETLSEETGSILSGRALAQSLPILTLNLSV